jgi:hypothetical protein
VSSVPEHESESMSGRQTASKGDYRAMICHLFLNKKKFPGIQKIIHEGEEAIAEGMRSR